jgi:cell division transport system ATP-binding protein
VLSFVIGFFPIVGSWSVYLPVAGWLLVFRDAPARRPSWSVVGTLFNTVFISMYVRPTLAAAKSRVLNFYWMFVGLVTGVYAFGLAGVLLGPLLIGLLKAVIDTVTTPANWRLVDDDARDADRRPPAGGPHDPLPVGDQELRARRARARRRHPARAQGGVRLRDRAERRRQEHAAQARLHGGAPTSGEVRVSGTTTTRLARREIPRLRRRLGVIFQNFLLLEDRTAAANVAFALEVTGAPRATIGPRVQRALAQVGLAGKSTSYPHELSGGEQQRIAIARALVNSPAVLIADEPTGNLDDRARRAVFQLLREVNASGTAVLMATHDLELVKRAGLRTIEMHGGRIVADRPAGGYPDLDTLEAV